MNKKLIGVALATTALQGAIAFADVAAISDDIRVSRSQPSTEGFYVGASIGNASYDDVDESDVGFNVFAGIDVNEILSAELGWASFGEAEGNTATAEVTAFHLAIVGSVALQNNLNAFGKLGMARWDADVRQGPVSSSDNGTDVFFGIGVDYQIGAGSFVRFGADFYGVDDEDVTFIGVGLKQRF